MSLQDDLNNLVEDPGSVPASVKMTVIVILMGVILFAGYKFLIVDELGELERIEKQEPSLKSKFETKQKKASLLPVYQAQLEEMRRNFGSMMQQLPSQTEIPGLILDISETGLSNGLIIEVFEPKAEVRKEFYAEKPISLKVIGTYNELANFASDVAALPRIVTLHDIDLLPAIGGSNSSQHKVQSDVSENDLVMKATVKTYRYLEEDDEEE